MRRVIFNRIMEAASSVSKIRPASPPQASLQPLDKRPRLTSPTVTPSLQAGITTSTSPKRSKKRKHAPPEFASPEDVISREVAGLLGEERVAQAEADGTEWKAPFGFREEVELTVSSISSSGMSYFKVCATRLTHIFSPRLPAVPVPVLTRRRTCPCPVAQASMGRRRSVRFTWRGHSRPRIQACKDVLLRRPTQYRSSKLGTPRHEPGPVQVLWDMCWMPVPGTAVPSGDRSSSYLTSWHRCCLTRHSSISNATWL